VTKRLPNRPARLLVLLGCLVALAVAGGCGSDDEGEPIPQAQAEELEKQLASIEDRLAFGGGACDDIENDNLPSVESIVSRVPESVDPDVRDALRESFDRLFELSREQCEAESETDTTPTETTPTETTPPETTRPETVPTETQEEGQGEEDSGKQEKPKKDENGEQGPGGGVIAPGGGD
jgi:hypothetical protein